MKNLFKISILVFSLAFSVPLFYFEFDIHSGHPQNEFIHNDIRVWSSYSSFKFKKRINTQFKESFGDYIEDYSYSQIFKYDSNNNLIQVSWSHHNRKRIYKYDSNNNLIQYNSTSNTKNIYKYDSNNNLLSESIYKKDGSLAAKNIYKYDSNNNLLSESMYKEDGSLDAKNIYK